MKLWRKQRQDEVPDVATSLRHIRAHFAALGYDLSECTDEEIIAGIERFSQFIATSKVTLRLAGDGIRMMQKAVHNWGTRDEHLPV